MRILIFIGLKIVEIAGILLIPFFVGYLPDKFFGWCSIVDLPSGSFLSWWASGLTTLVLLLMALMLVAIIVAGIIKNYKMAGELRDRFSKKS